MRSLTYVEIDIDYCSLTYGVAPCMAELGVTGAIKCFNSPKTCQDRANFTNAPVTIRFGIDSAYLPKAIECVPCLLGVSVTPAVVSLGKDLGLRATVTARFSDHRHSDTGVGFDKYLADRGYDPFTLGTFFGKFRARHPYLRGRSFRLIRGLLPEDGIAGEHLLGSPLPDDVLEQQEVRHYIGESFQGPGLDGTYSIVSKDVLKLADGDRAQAPVLSQGFLVTGIDDNDTSATLSPAGIGNASYPASNFYAAIGGEEIVHVSSRAGDVLTIDERGALGTTAVAHNTEDRVQLVLRYVGQDPATIISDLLVNYAGIPSGFIPIDEWLEETGTFLARVNTATIAEPVAVGKLVSELCEQDALAIWWDDRRQKLRLQVLRPIATTSARFDAEKIVEGTLRITEQPGTRLSQVWTYYGIRNPLKSVEDPDNYRSVAVNVDLEAEADYGTPAIKIIYSRWIPPGGRSIAERGNNIQLGRYRDPPRRFALDLFRYGDDEPELGGGYRIGAWPLQDETGALVDAPVQVIKLNPAADRFILEAEEMLFSQYDENDLLNRVIPIEANDLNINLREWHDNLYPLITDPTGITVTFVVNAGVLVGSADPTLPAIDVGDWPDALDLRLTVRGRIQGAGGDGGRSRNGDEGPAPTDGHDGGVALLVGYPISVDADGGQIFGGAGGGAGTFGGFGSGGGGGGAGQLPGDGGVVTNGGTGSYGDPGTTEAGGASGGGWPFPGGDGGDPGEPGEDSASFAGGAAGAAIDGVSLVTITGSGTGDIRGPQIN